MSDGVMPVRSDRAITSSFFSASRIIIAKQREGATCCEGPSLNQNGGAGWRVVRPTDLEGARPWTD